MSKPSAQHFSIMTFAIVVMSSSGTLGRYITLEPPVTIWARCVIGAVALFAVMLVMKVPVGLSTKSRNIAWVSSVLLGIHWITYFYALHYSTVAIGMLSLFTYPIFTALLEPMILNQPFEKRHLPMTILALGGLYFLVPEFSLSNDYTLGIMFGIVSSITYSVRNILLKKGVSSESGLVLMFYQLVGISIYLLPVLLIFQGDLVNQFSSNIRPLLLLGLITTATGHTLFVVSFRYFSVTTVSILSNLTPLFGIGLGIWVLGEHPEGNVYLGGAIILALTIVESLFSLRKT